MPNAARILAVMLFTAVFVFAPEVAKAQNGRLIEGLFRTLAEQQLEKEKLKRTESQKRPPALRPPGQNTIKPSNDPYQVKLPSGFGGRPDSKLDSRPKPKLRPNGTVAPTSSINVRSREASQYAQRLVAFNRNMDPLISQLRSAARKHPEVRSLLPQAYQIAADSRALLQRCNGISSLSPIINPYAELDARWRQVSFALRSINGISPEVLSSVQQCDETCAAMCKQLQIQPQFDRHALHDQMVIASTYMQSIVDDLEIAGIDPGAARKLTHDCRLLRQRILRAADHVEDASYDEMAASFSDFVQHWGAFAQQIYGLGNPHLDRRLARISECGDQTYAILWMSPPAAFRDVAEIAHRIDTSIERLSQQITLLSIAALPSGDQSRVLNATRDLYQQAVALEKAANAKADVGQLQSLFASLDNTWLSVQSDYPKIRTVNRGLLGDIERACGELRVALGVAGSESSSISASQLIQAAAALEGTSEFINSELRKYSRDLTPSSFRNSVTSAAREFYTHARELHEEISKPGRLSDPRYLSRLQREAEHLLEGWDQLSKDMDHIEEHGLSRSKAFQLRRTQRDITPFVAQIAAALLAE
ncbi:hypothetical protein [Planctomycetes bacterium K23_9]|uniref:Uncharacterized protein n=1 Tax=Stieleria marina TaxID=1930275 RepID=A0A517NTD0_9BACT|nr:hypothetical protein K239x_23330 [Planctomycetes bacterium K23_9]